MRSMSPPENKNSLFRVLSPTSTAHDRIAPGLDGTTGSPHELLMTTVSACQPADDEAAAGSTLTDVGPATGGEGGAGEGGAQAAGGLGGTLPDPDQGVAGGGRPAPDATTGPGGADASTDAAPAPDTDARTAPTPDGGPGPESDAGVPPPVCPERALPAIDGPRVVLVGHPFTDVPGVDGTMIHGLTLQPNGRLDDDGIRLDVEVKAARIAFAPHGLLAFVLGEDGTLVSVFVAAAEGMAVVDRVSLPGADYGDLHVSPDGETVWVTGSNVNETSGISTIHVDCEGLLTVDDAAYFPLRLAESTAFLPGDTRALVLGGQTVFEPVDPNDVRLLERQGAGFREVGGFDLFHDFVGAGRIAVSPDGRLGALPNNSAFSEEGGQMMLVEIDGDAVREVERVTRGARPGRGPVLTRRPDPRADPGRARAPERVSHRERGDHRDDRAHGHRSGGSDRARGARPLADTLLIPSIDPNGGPNISHGPHHRARAWSSRPGRDSARRGPRHRS
jgi:hypothetical protein